MNISLHKSGNKIIRVILVILGLGALAFYGLGFGNQAGAIDKSIAWPAYVKQRIRDTYMYFGASIGITAATAASIFRSPALTNIVMRQGNFDLI